jgi:hypothetical protein
MSRSFYFGPESGGMTLAEIARLADADRANAPPTRVTT